MIRDARAGVWLETALFALASVLLAQMGLGVFLFLVPLQILFIRRGAARLGAAAALSFAGTAGVRLVGAAAGGTLEASRGFLTVELFAIAILLLGLVLLNVYDGRPPLRSPLRAVPRLLIATVAAGLLCVPALLVLSGRKELTESIRGVFQSAADSVANLFTQASRLPESEGSSGAAALASGMLEVALQVLPRTFLLYYFVILTFSWWAGSRASARAGLRTASPRPLRHFKLPDAYIWPLIGSLALVLLDVAFGLGALASVAWNASLIMLFLFGLQGLGIVQFFFDRYSVGRALRVVAYVVLIVMLVSPGANIAVVVGVPGLGVSEIWLRYRTRRRKVDADEGDP